MSTDPGRALEIFLHDEAVGKLERLPQARLRFAYHLSWVAAQGRPLSLSLPVRPETYEHDECAPFFEGLGPRVRRDGSAPPTSPRSSTRCLNAPC